MINQTLDMIYLLSRFSSFFFSFLFISTRFILFHFVSFCFICFVLFVLLVFSWRICEKPFLSLRIAETINELLEAGDWHGMSC